MTLEQRYEGTEEAYYIIIKEGQFKTEELVSTKVHRECAREKEGTPKSQHCWNRARDGENSWASTRVVLSIVLRPDSLLKGETIAVISAQDGGYEK